MHVHMKYARVSKTKKQKIEPTGKRGMEWEEYEKWERIENKTECAFTLQQSAWSAKIVVVFCCSFGLVWFSLCTAFVVVFICGVPYHH